MAIGTLKAGANSQDVTASTGLDVADTVNYLYENTKISNKALSTDGIIFIGDSITEGETSVSTFSRIYGIQQALSGRLVAYNGFNQGVGGDTTADVLARMSTIGASMQKVCDIMIGTNDVSNNVTLATYSENIMNIISQCFGYGAEAIVIHTIPLKADDATFPWSESQKALRNSYNQFLSSLDLNGVIVDSTSVDTIDPVTMYTDGTHLNIYGSLVFGGSQAEYIKYAVEQKDVFSGYLSDNLFTNPQLTGTSGTAGGVSTGDVASNWTVGCNVSGGATVTLSKTANVFGDGTTAQTAEIIGTSDSQITITSLKQTVAIPATTVDDVYVATIRYKVERAAGLTNLSAKIINNVFESIGEAKTTSGITVTDGFSGVITTSVIAPVSAGVTSITAEFPIRNIIGELDILIHLDKPVIRKVL